MKIQKITSLPHDIMHLISESESEGFRFIRRFKDEFDSKLNTFSKHGEALFAATIDDSLIAIGGVNNWGTNTNKIGRLRRFYVSKAYRNNGVGRRLLDRIETHAFEHFDTLVLYTEASGASNFYLNRGYTGVVAQKVSHQKQKPQQAFIARGLAARDQAKSTSQYASKSETMDSLRSILQKAIHDRSQ
jgi:GNAT superfamily N-acetyltransferase